MIALTTRILNDTFVQYSLDFPYIGIDGIQRNYILLTETDLKHCAENGITRCPANRAIFRRRVITSESSLFFRTPDSQSLCQKRLFLHYKTPTLLRHNSVWIFHSPTLNKFPYDIWKTTPGLPVLQLFSGRGSFTTHQCVLLIRETSKRCRYYWDAPAQRLKLHIRTYLTKSS